jgi:hypothetical protein
MSTTQELERVVAEAADFLETIGEDLRVAAIMASADEQPRRAAALGNAAVRAKRLSDEIDRAWAASHHDKVQAEDMADKGDPANEPPAVVDRDSVPITDVCDALGISATSALSIDGDVEHVPIDRLTLLTKLRALRELREATVNAALAGAIEVSRRTQVVEDGLLQRALAKIAETDRAWLERELGAKS